MQFRVALIVVKQTEKRYQEIKRQGQREREKEAKGQ